MLFYILVVAVLNLGLGFGMAVYFGRGHRSVAEAGDVRVADAAPDIAAGAESEDDSQSQPAAEPPPPQSPSEKAVGGLMAEVGQYHDRLAEVDDQLRACVETPDATAIEECLNSLRGATQEYLTGRGAAYSVLQALQEEPAESSAIRDSVESAIERQDEHLARTGAVVEAFNYLDGPEEGCKNLVSQTSTLIDENHQLRDSLDKAMVEITRNEKRLGKTDPTARSDTLTGLLNRLGLEAALLDWWEQDPGRSRQLCVAMVDIDHFAQTNERYGHKLGDRILSALAQLLTAENRGEGTVARLSGQRFFFTFPDADAHFATGVAERVRQTVEIAHFQYTEFDARITVSCGVTEANSTDTSETLFGRAEAALQEAKRYGRNRTFLHDGKYPTPVMPPSLSLQEKQIAV